MTVPQDRPSAAVPPGGRPATAVTVQTGPASGELDENLRAAGKLARSASVRQALFVFPELFSRPFWCLGMSDPRYLSWAEPVTGPTVSFAAELATDLESVVVAPFFERGAMAGEYFNSVAVIGPSGRLLPGRLPDGTPVSVYRKNAVSAYRWGEAVNDEKYYFRPGTGFAVFDTPLARIGVLICLDRWFPEAWRVLALRGAEVICVVNASAGDVDALFVPMMQVCAAQNIVFAVAANRVGDEEVAGRRAKYYGQSCIADPAGKVLAQASRETPEALVATFDPDQVAEVRQRRTMYRDRRPELYGAITEAPR